MTPIDPAELLRRLTQQLSQAGTPTGSNLVGAGLADRAFLSVWPDDVLVRNVRARQFVAVRPSRFPLWQTVIQGAGSPINGYDGNITATGFNAVVSLVLFNQNNADPENWSAQAATEDTLGFINLALRVMSAVQFWNPFVGSGVGKSYYLREPARVTDGGFSINQRTIKDSFWTTGSLDCELKFTGAFPPNMGGTAL